MTRPWFPGHRDPALCERDLERYRHRHPRLFPQLERTPDLSRGELRLAAEVALAVLQGGTIPEMVMDRALSIAEVMARG